MATVYYTWNAVPVAQVNTITPATVAIGDVFNVTINGKVISFTAAAATVANVVNGLQPLLAASTIPEFTEVTWTANGTANIVGTAATAGVPFVQTSSASGTGSPTFVTATATASAGPNDASSIGNYATSSGPYGQLPQANDTLTIANSSQNIYYGLTALAGVTLDAVSIPATFTGRIGLPLFATTNQPGNAGTGYAQYRPQYLQLKCPTYTVTIGGLSASSGLGNANGSGRIKLDFQSYATTLVVNQTGSPVDSPLESVLVKGSSGSNVLTINRGSVGVAVLPGETAALASWTCAFITAVQSDAWLRFGSGVTLSGVTGNQTGGQVTVQSASGAITQSNGVLNVVAGAQAGITSTAGTVNYFGNGTLSSYTGYAGSVLDFSDGVGGVTVTACTMYGSAILRDPQQRTVGNFTAGIISYGCPLSNFNFGSNFTLTPTAV